MHHTIKYQQSDEPMQPTITYHQNDEAHATHNHLPTQRSKNHATQRQIPTKRENPCNTQSSINNTIKPMHHTIKYQQNDNTHATHNQMQTTP